MRNDAIVFAGLMPHAPILVPGVGRDRLVQVRRTVSAMVKEAGHAVAANPDTVVLVSPHSPRRAGAFGIWRTPRLRGSLDQFGSPGDQVDLPSDRTFADRLEEEIDRRGLRTWRITGGDLDHGATVPLVYLVSAGWKGPTVIVSLSDVGAGGVDELGQAIAATAQALHRRVAVIASGDMSHRLTPTAPSGYAPEGKRFDETFLGLLRRGAPAEIGRIDPAMQEAAAEDVVDSTRVALAATGYATKGHDVLSYEGPFGVGYGVAVLFERSDSGVTPQAAVAEKAMLTEGAELPKVARCAVAAGFKHGTDAPPFLALGELAEQHGVFVTVRTAAGELRGCRGSPGPTQKDLVWETWHSAVAAAFHDHRFPPLHAQELPHLRFSVSVLGPLEPDVSPQELDPAIYGVVITAGDGRKGLLLPGLAGIGTVAQQLAGAREKAGIGPDEPVKIQRFTARSFEESPPFAKGV
jgi:AmmeMemoRadiSam system protein A